MSIHHRFEGAQFVAQTADIAMKNGVSLRVGTCFSEYAELIEKHRPHQPVGRPFDYRHNNFHPANGFWIAGWDEKGALVQSQAMRLIDLGGVPLSAYLSKRFQEFPPAGIDLDFARSRYNPGPSAHRIQGMVCYHGDFWLREDYRSSGMSNILARFALASALLRWSPDYVIGFMPRPIAFKGLAEREGYMHCEPGTLYWRRAGTDKDFEAFMVWVGREDLNFLLTIPVAGMA